MAQDSSDSGTAAESSSGAAPAEKRPPKVRTWDRLVDSPNSVTIFGAGIAGLTAAHELVERGFNVQVWERQGDQRHPERGCDVGGLARTQWSAVRWPLSKELDQLPNPRLPFEQRRTNSISIVPQRVYLTWNVGLLAAMGAHATDKSTTIREVLEAAGNRLTPEFRLRVRCYWWPEVFDDIRSDTQNFAEALRRSLFWTLADEGKPVHARLGDQDLRISFGTQAEFRLLPKPHPAWPSLIVDQVVGDTEADERSPAQGERHLWPRAAKPRDPERSMADLIEFLHLGEDGEAVEARRAEERRALAEQRAIVEQEGRPPGESEPHEPAHDADAAGATPGSQVSAEKLVDTLPPGAARAESADGGRRTAAEVNIAELQTFEAFLAGLDAYLSSRLTKQQKRSFTLHIYDISTAYATTETLRARTSTIIKELKRYNPHLGFELRPHSSAADALAEYDVTKSGRHWFTVDIRLHSSRYPDWTDLRLEHHEGESFVARRYWAPGAQDAHTLSPPPTSTLSNIEDSPKELTRLCERLLQVSDNTDAIYVEVTSRWVSRLSAQERDRRVDLARRLLEAHMRGAKDWRGKLAAAGLGPEGKKLIYRWIDSFPYNVYDRIGENVETVIAFRPRERWIPGEHGYRFFPSFYHHLFDTMKRTPLLEVEDKPEALQAQERASGVPHPEPVQYVESGRTTFDNLKPTSSYVLAFGRAQRTSQVSRVPFSSLEEIRQYLSVLFGSRESGGFGLSPRDTTRLVLKILQFATACEARRTDYENLSWWEYLDGDAFGEDAQYLLQRLPEALVAMDAQESDARTQWVPFFQILLDQVRPDNYRDGTLTGPTSEAWLIPWRRYLEAQGVEFIAGELEGFKVVDVEGERRIHPEVLCFDPRYDPDLLSPPLRPGYYIIAVSAEEARRLGEEYKALRDNHGSQGLTWPEREDSDLLTLAELGGRMSLQELDRELLQPRPNSDFRHFAGVQYYFAEDVYWVDGHVYYPDSEWSITSISQARFWQDKMDWEHGYRGVLSAIVGAWDVKSRYLNKTAWECDEAELAEEVWRQITEGVKNLHDHRSNGVGRFSRRTPFEGRLPEPVYWHLDQSLGGLPKEAEAPKDYRYWNRTPFLIAAPGEFGNRPGRLDKGHQVEHGFVVAGYYTQTHTRVPSMEAANESARHAVNAILQHLGKKRAPGHEYRQAYCDIWNPEDREVDDFRLLKDLDAHLHKKGLPHVMEILSMDELAQNLFRGGPGDPMDPLRLISRIQRMFRGG